MSWGVPVDCMVMNSTVFLPPEEEEPQAANEVIAIAQQMPTAATVLILFINHSFVGCFVAEHVP